jgi:hypothetical protein
MCECFLLQSDSNYLALEWSDFVVRESLVAWFFQIIKPPLVVVQAVGVFVDSIALLVCKTHHPSDGVHYIVHRVLLPPCDLGLPGNERKQPADLVVMQLDGARQSFVPLCQLLQTFVDIHAVIIPLGCKSLSCRYRYGDTGNEPLPASRQMWAHFI